MRLCINFLVYWTAVVCAEIHCDGLVKPANGDILSCSSGIIGSGYEGDTCMFMCDEGYVLANHNGSVCLSNGSWSVTNPCKRVCLAPHNGDADCGSGLVQTAGLVGDNCTFTCNTGYLLYGNVTNGTCESSGNWSGGNPICRRNSCPNHITTLRTDKYSQVVEHTTILAGCGLEYQSTCNVSCDYGYTGNSIIYLCNVTNTSGVLEWVPDDDAQPHLMCQIVHCNTTLINGTSHCDYNVYKEHCAFRCNQGYVAGGPFDDYYKKVCLGNGSWSGGNPVCVPRKCPSSPPNSEIEMFETSCVPNYQLGCATECRYGYNGVGGYYTCELFGAGFGWEHVKWVGETTCTPGCLAPHNGHVDCGSRLVQTAGLVGDNCTFTCNTGYLLYGNVTNGVCESSGNWSGGNPTCRRNSCPNHITTLRTDKYSQVVEHITILAGCGLEYQSTCNVSCDYGYTGNSITYLCNVTNTSGVLEWVPDDDAQPHLMCQIVHCNTTIINGTSHCDYNVYKEHCAFRCNQGYVAGGPYDDYYKKVCLGNGSWSGGNPVCVPRKCPSSPPNSEIEMFETSCVPNYQLGCATECRYGYNGVGGYYTCELFGAGFGWEHVKWVGETTCTPAAVDNSSLCFNNASQNATNSDVNCQKGCLAPHNGHVDCGSGLVQTAGLVGDNCTFTCNTGYLLYGNVTNGTCEDSGNWSRGNPTCRRNSCPNHLTTLRTDKYSQVVEHTTILAGCGLEFQSTCNVSCDYGYTGNSITYLCNVTNTSGVLEWVPVDDAQPHLMCHIVHCNTTLINGTSHCDYNVYKEHCAFRCNQGYVAGGPYDDYYIKVCLGNGSWSGGNPVCVPQKCPSSPPNSEIEIFETSCVPNYQLGCATECRYGYNGVGGYYTCELFGAGFGWEHVKWVGETTCTPVQCPALYNPTNGTLLCSQVNSLEFSYQDNCTLHCDVGYQLTGTANRTCQGDSSWSGSLASCSIMQCSLSSVPTNAVISETCQSIYQSVCELHCPEGYIGSGNPQYVCKVNDKASVTWTPAGETFKCDQVQCSLDSLSLPDHSLVSCNSTGAPHYQDQCSFSCDQGYQLNGSSSIHCLSNGSWSRFSFTCDILYCGNLSDAIDLNNTEFSSADCGTEYGSLCTVHCKVGYTFNSGNSFICDVVNNNRTEWRNIEGGTYHCEIVTCQQLESFPHGQINCNGNQQQPQFEDYCSFQCSDGFELEGSAERWCGANGKWNGTRPQCNIHHCVDITVVVPNSIPCNTSYLSTCMVQCKDGYNMLGDSSKYTCDFNGTDVIWMGAGSGVTCSPVLCSYQQLNSLHNGGVHCPHNTSSVYKDTCSYYCDPGYQLEGSSQITCTAKGTWSNEQVSCIPVHCKQLFEPDNGNVTCPNNFSIYQDTCTYYCNHGYLLDGNSQTQCRADGTWSSEPVTCNPLKCLSPHVEIANSQLVGSCNKTYGSRCLVNCSSDNNSHSNMQYVFCDDLGENGTLVKWQSVQGTLTCTNTTSGSASAGNSTGVVVAGVIAFFVIMSVLTLLVVWMYRYFKKKKAYSVVLTSDDDDGLLLPQRQ
ncbi:sushi, von Willebrand factor type A, EGF and pentraxin domain-containing protein 1-like isoform X3 [Dysidea avara]|uniref:sushi, von Willebrand factor type A, EGF and pentraxin domain-containing protein 1-like isoform X3 n=1 Tax=Dysidea avara TaxID=196820 RepID=UPI0033307C6B